MKLRGRPLLTACIVASCLASAPADADVLIESYPEQRPADADAVLAAFRAELVTLGVKVRAADVVAAAGALVPPPGSADDADRAAAIASYARSSREHDVVVAGIVVRDDRRFLTASLFEKQTGALLRTKVILLGVDDVACKRALAHAVMTGTESVCLLALPAPSAPRARAVASGPAPRSRRPIYVATGTAVAAFLVGGYLFQLDGSGTCGSPYTVDCPEIYATRGPAWAFLSVGVAALGFGIYWHLHIGGDAQSAARVSLQPTPQGALASVGGTF